MNPVIELVERADRLSEQFDAVRDELERLRQDLRQLQNGSNGAPPATTDDCLLLAKTLAIDLGPDISSESPGAFANRGSDWFEGQ